MKCSILIIIICTVPTIMTLSPITVYSQEFNNNFEVEDDEYRSIKIMDICTEYEKIISQDLNTIEKFDPSDIENCERILDRDIDGIDN